MSDGNRPVPMTKEELASTLENMARLVRGGDSLEGSLEYLLPGPEDGEQEDWAVMVRAGYRIGNLHGQGSFRMIGRPPTTPPISQVASVDPAEFDGDRRYRLPDGTPDPEA